MKKINIIYSEKKLPLKFRQEFEFFSKRFNIPYQIMARDSQLVDHEDLVNLEIPINYQIEIKNYLPKD